MNLLDEILDARKEFIQEEWDKTLIRLWKTRSNYTMAYAMAKFISEYNLNPEEFFKLHRIPRAQFQQRVRITRFVAAYLPVLSTHLWNNNKTDEELLKICIKLQTMFLPSDNTKSVAEKYELRQSQKKFEASEIERRQFFKKKDKKKRTNWEAAKQ